MNATRDTSDPSCLLAPLCSLALFGVTRWAFASAPLALPGATAFFITMLAVTTGRLCADVARGAGYPSPWHVGFGVPSLSFASAVGVASGNPSDMMGVLAVVLFVIVRIMFDAVTEELARAAVVPTPPPVRVARPVLSVAPPALTRASCQVCGERLLFDVVSCARCATPHHAECFAYAERCSTYGCGCRIAA